MTPDSNPSMPPDDSTITGQARRLKRFRPNMTKRKRVIAGSVSGVILSVAAASLVLTGVPLLEGSSAPAKSTPPPIVVTTPATPEAFPTFERQDYVQPEVPATATGQVQATTLTVGSEATGKIMPEGLAGLSLDTDHLIDSYMNPDQSNLDEILSMGGDPVLRFGGQAADRRFFWTSTDEPIPDWNLVPVSKNDHRQIVKVTPAVLENVNRLLIAANARVLMTANFGHADAARTADLAVWAHKIFGDRLVGLSIGNEPNGWGHDVVSYYTLRDGSWDPEQYINQVMPVAQAVKDAAPEVNIVGPDVYSIDWWKPYVKAGIPDLKALTYHHYPVSMCDADPAVDPKARSIPNLMSPENAQSSREYAEAAVKVAESANLATWNTETNASSCPGSSAVTKNHASALWTVNYALTSASVGVTMLNFHGGLEACKGGAPMSPLCDNGPFQNPSGVLDMRAQYYGIMMTNKLGSGDFMRSSKTGSENIYAYPVKHPDGSMSIMVVNQNDPMTQAPTQITLKLPTQAATGTMTQMAGPSFEDEDATRIDGLESNGEPLDAQGKIPGFNAGDQTFTVALNSGTATILNFTF